MAYQETKSMSQPFETVIGLEVHLQLSTKTKIFCGCANVFGSAPNTNVCPVCLGLPGALPYINRQAIEDCIKIGLALNCQISDKSLLKERIISILIYLKVIKFLNTGGLFVLMVGLK